MFLEVYSQVLGPATSELKRCPKCGEYKTRDGFSVRRGRKDGLQSYCKSCNAAYREVNRDRHIAYCRAYNAEHSKEQYEKQRARRAKDPEKGRQYRRDYHQANREKHLAYFREYYQKNQNERTEYRRAYIRTEKGRAARSASNHRRRARQMETPAMFTVADEQFTRGAFDGGCAVCGRQPGLWHTIALDHWIPLTAPDCPGTVPWNMVPLCHGVDGCNNSKHNRNAEAWLIEKFGPRKGRVTLRRIEAFLKSRRPAEGA